MSFDAVIPDLAGYTARMALGMEEKLFFLDPAVEAAAAARGWRAPSVLVDFGCADGTTLALVGAARPAIRLIGYDLSAPELALAEAARRRGSLDARTALFDDRDALDRHLDRLCRTPGIAGGITLLLSSVIHEVHAYGTPESIDDFWAWVSSGPFDQVIIRDMACRAAMADAADPGDVARLRATIARLDAGAAQRLADFEQTWGRIDPETADGPQAAGGRQRLIHFLLKYRYANNWSRELTENYLPLDAEAIARRLPAHRAVHWDSHVHGWTAAQVARDFGIVLEDATHLKALFTRADHRFS